MIDMDSLEHMNNVDERICRSLRGRTSDEEEAELRRWRDRAPANEAYFTELCRLLSVAEEVSASEVALHAPTAADVIELGEGAPLLDLNGSPARPAAREFSRRNRRTNWIPLVAAVAAGLALGFGGVFERLNPPGFQMGAAEFVSGPNEVTTATLADGSVIRLAPESRLRVVPADGRREVHLTGRAYLAVARMPDLPFHVRTAMGEVVVLGTRFDVRATDELRVVVVEGRVALANEESRVEVEAGHMSMVAGGRVMTPVKVDVDAVVDWIGPFLAFQSTSLADVARELEQEYGARVVLADSSLADLTITGWYIDRSFEEVVVLVCGVLGAQCSIQDRTATIASPPKTP